MNKYGIIVICYNRLHSIKRLVKSLFQADYCEPADLIISIDNSGSNIVENFAKSIKWPYGKKIIHTYPKRLGLKEHVLTCGNYINKYNFESIIVLEDDLLVSPGYFNYAIQATQKYKNNLEVAGISLYTHSWNINADRPFIPLFNGYDVFFMQYPQSWGQIWMKKQWNDFYKWYQNQEYKTINKNLIPANVLQWPKSSWLKYHVEYCIVKDKYFVYPYNSLSTNFADAGTHYIYNTNKMQVPLNVSVDRSYQFPYNFEDAVFYDSYYENKNLEKVLNLKENSLVVDLYGLKKIYGFQQQYLLTTKVLPY